MQPVPFLSGHALFLFLFQVGLLIAVAIILGQAARRCGLPALVGEMLAGIFLGPSVLQHFWPTLESAIFPRDLDQYHLLDGVGQVGVLLLVAFAGSELDLTSARRKLRTTVCVSLFGLLIPLISGIAIGFGLPASLRGDHSPRYLFAIFLGVSLCVSAIPVIAKTLMDLGLMHRNVSQLALAAAIFDDTAAWVLLSIVAALAAAGLSIVTVSIAAGALIGTGVFTILVARPIVKLVIRCFAVSNSAVTSGAVVSMVLLAAAGTHLVGLEALLGAFLCGILIRRYLPRKSDAIEPVRSIVTGVLAPLFFATAGLRIDVSAVAKPVVALSAVAVLMVAIVGKFVGAYLGCRLSRLGHWEAVAVGSALNARGVVEIIIAMAGLRLGIISSDMFTIIVIVAVVTSVLAPPLLRIAMNRIPITNEERFRQESSTPTHSNANAIQQG